MSSVADKAAARRAKILARSKDRMATVTGAPPPAAAEGEQTMTDVGADTSLAAAPSEAALSAADADAALEAALNEVQAPAASTTQHASAIGGGADQTPSATSAAGETEIVDDPHEFPSSAELGGSIALAPMSHSSGAEGSDSDVAFRSFAHALHTASAGSAAPSQASAAYKRRQARESAAAASTLSQPLPPAHSPLTRWRARVKSKLHDTHVSRSLTVVGVVAAAVLAGLGHLEGGVAWLLLVQLLVRSAAFLYTQATTRTRTTPAASLSRPAPSPPPMDARSPSAPSASADDDQDVLELDTDAYTSANRAPTIPGFPGFPGFPGLDGSGIGGIGSGGSLSALGLPPAVDTLLSGAQLFFKYAAVMRQLLNDTMLFLFVTVITNAALQLTYDEPVIYVAQ